jgi:hypothetical protein
MLVLGVLTNLVTQNSSAQGGHGYSRWHRKTTLTDDVDLASELKLLVALSICTLVCVIYIYCKFI